MNRFGRNFCISLFGASHTPVLGVDIYGCPAGMDLNVEMFASDIVRRRAGTLGTTPRVERDIPLIESGCDGGYTTGEVIRIAFENRDIRPEDYKAFLTHPRPGHADWVAQQKYGKADANQYGELPTGGGIFSGRMTLPLTAAGVVAKCLLQRIYPDLQISGKLVEVGGRFVSGCQSSFGVIAEERVAACGGIRAGDDALAEVIREAQAAGDSLGGVIECRAVGVPVGLGEPFFDSVESCISHLVFSIPGIKGIEFGAGFAAAKMRGSEHNDCFIDAQGCTATNHAGGINGGITNGNEIIFRVAVKPTPSISLTQETFDFAANEIAPLSIQGRHDICFALRLPVVMEAVTAIVLADFSLTNK